MGQEVSLQKSSSIGRRQKSNQNSTLSSEHKNEKLDSKEAIILRPQQKIPPSATKIRRSSRKYDLVKPKLSKRLSLDSDSSNSFSSGYLSSSTSSAASTSDAIHSKTSSFKDKSFPKARNYSHSSDSGIYLSSASSCYCSSRSNSSLVSSEVSTEKSWKKSADKQKKYLNHHLYFKSYLDILEEDEKARKLFKAARPGIRNYTPKILSDGVHLPKTCTKSQSFTEDNQLWI